MDGLPNVLWSVLLECNVWLESCSARGPFLLKTHWMQRASDLALRARFTWGIESSSTASLSGVFYWLCSVLLECNLWLE